MIERTDLGERSDVAALLALTPVSGLALVDVGCGAGRNARDLAEAGATVLGVEPDPIQAARNREGAHHPPRRLRRGARRAPAGGIGLDRRRGLLPLPSSCAGRGDGRGARRGRARAEARDRVSLHRRAGHGRNPLSGHAAVPRRDAGSAPRRPRSTRRAVAVRRARGRTATCNGRATRISTRLSPACSARPSTTFPRAGRDR